MTSVAALFVAANGPYFGLPHVDPWDIDRDARKYRGPWPVVAHPPCQVWCQLAFINQKRYGHPVGADEGKFWCALDSVRRYGGVLEHPARTYAWPHFETPAAEAWAVDSRRGRMGHPGLATRLRASSSQADLALLRR